jgi:hypothetical protein
MLYALADGSAVIRVAHLKAALAVWNYCRDSARLLFKGEQPDKPEPLWLEVLNTIEAKPGIHRSKLTKQFNHKANAEQLGEVLTWLVKQGKAYPTVENTAGRKAERWWAGKPDDNLKPSQDRDSDNALSVGAGKEERSSGQSQEQCGSAKASGKEERSSEREVGRDAKTSFFFPKDCGQRKEPDAKTSFFFPEDCGQRKESDAVKGREVVIPTPERPAPLETANRNPAQTTDSSKSDDSSRYWCWEPEGAYFISFERFTDSCGNVFKQDRIRHSTQADAERRVKRETERHRKWLIGYYASQAKQREIERKRTGADEPPATEEEIAEFFQRLLAL